MPTIRRTKPRASKPVASTRNDPAVDEFMRNLKHPLKPEVESIRRLILGIRTNAGEGIKWSSPSFRTADWFATVNLRAKGGEQRVWLILHTGAKSKAFAKHGLAIDDPTRLLEWLGKDRALVTFRDGKDLASKRTALKGIIKQWIALLDESSKRAIARSAGNVKRTQANDQSLEAQCREVMATLRRLGEPRVKRDMHERYGITGPTAERSFGVAVGKLQKLAKSIGVNHELSLALWNHDGGWYDARMLATLIGDPARVTAAQMDAWCRDFDNWGICDTVCFKLFDRVEPALAFRKIDKWSRQRDEFVKRGGFALLACVALHRKDIPDSEFIDRLPLIERGSTDDRNFVKKGVLWALRGVGSRTPARRKAALAMARSLAESTNTAARWVGRNAARELGR